MYKDSESCQCKECQEMCDRPCWPTPSEAKALIEAGYRNRLMMDYWARRGGDIEIVSPALKGYEGKYAPFWPSGSCTFFKDGLCELHNLNLKPMEGRVASCKSKNEGLHEHMMTLWDTNEGREVVRLWKQE